MVNVGDKVVITKMSGRVLETPQVATVEDVRELWFKIEDAINGDRIVFKDNIIDEWHKEESPDSGINNERVKAGSNIIVTRVNGNTLESPKKALVVDVSIPIIQIYPEVNGESLLHVGTQHIDDWYIVEEDKDLENIVSTPKEGEVVKVFCNGRLEYGEVVETDVTEAGEYEFKVKSGESSKTYKLNQVDSIETYKGDEDKIMPNYIQLASQGMTFSEFAGEDITEESLNFRPYDDKVNHPSHYNKYSREVIESIKGLCTPDEFRGYLKGNIIKYSARYSDKDGIQDIDKLAKYTQFLKEFELEQAELSEEE